MGVRQIGFAVPDSISKKLMEYCSIESSEIGERPGFIFRRLLFSLCILIDADFSVADIMESAILLAELKERGCSIKELGGKAFIIVHAIKEMEN